MTQVAGPNNAGLAHLVERLLAKQQVVGSSPISRSNLRPLSSFGRATDL